MKVPIATARSQHRVNAAPGRRFRDTGQSGVDVLQHEGGVGAAEAERVRQDVAELGVVPTLRRIGMSAKAGSSSSICALSQMKPLFIISRL